MNRVTRIGTRDSQLALWQAGYVQNEITKLGVESVIVPIKSHGEDDTMTPLYEMGVQGIFTKALDIALLEKKIDIAVHSLKDVPTLLPKGLEITAIPKRGNPYDILVHKSLPQNNMPYTIATSSLRRKAQWLYQYPHHQVDSIRGNINTRMQKLHDKDQWDGVLFAAAGIERIGLETPNEMTLPWMIPAPGQGALAIVCASDDLETKELGSHFDDFDSRTCVEAERQFLRHLFGGCTMPIGAHAKIEGGYIYLRGCICNVEGTEKIEVTMSEPLAHAANIGKNAAKKVLNSGGREIIIGYTKIL